MIFANPVERILHYILAHTVTARLVVIDRVTPGRLVLAGKIWSEQVKVIAFIAEVVINHVEQHPETLGMRGIHQTPQSLRAAIAGLHRVRRYAVISPVA